MKKAENPAESGPPGREVKDHFGGCCGRQDWWWRWQSSGSFSEAMQTQIMLGVRQRFTNAGVRNVEILTPGSKRFGFFENLVNSSKTIDISFTAKNLSTYQGKQVGMLYGQNRGSSASVSTFHVPTSDSAGLANFSTNIGSHEGGHATGAFPEYFYDFLAAARLRGKQAVKGSIMETGVEVELLTRAIREFSAEDAAKLRAVLNVQPDGR